MRTGSDKRGQRNAVLQTLLDHIQQTLLDLAHLSTGQPAQRSFQNKHGETVHRRPCQIFRAWTSF